MNAINQDNCKLRRNCIKLDEMHQNLEQRRREDADEINRERSNLQNMRVEVQRDADPLAANDSNLEVRQAAFEERKERLQRFCKSRENAVEGKRMELELVWRKKEAKLNDERRELELWDSTVASRDRQERICSNCAHKRLGIETRRKRFLRPQNVQRSEELKGHTEAFELQQRYRWERHRKRKLLPCHMINLVRRQKLEMESF